MRLITVSRAYCTKSVHEQPLDDGKCQHRSPHLADFPMVFPLTDTIGACQICLKARLKLVARAEEVQGGRFRASPGTVAGVTAHTLKR